MKSKRIWFGICLIALAAIAASWTVSARDDGRDASIRYHGVINDFPVSTNPAAGPWELRGPWSIDLHPQAGTADFSAALTMELSDLGAGAGTTTDARHQHTHHITMKAATLVLNPPQTDCPTGITPYPTYTWLVEVKGMADIAGNGGSPFAAPVPLQVCLGGGPNLQVSNITLVFTNLSTGSPSPATYHFGMQPIHGVVRLSH